MTVSPGVDVGINGWSGPFSAIEIARDSGWGGRSLNAGLARLSKAGDERPIWAPRFSTPTFLPYE